MECRLEIIEKGCLCYEANFHLDEFIMIGASGATPEAALARATQEFIRNMARLSVKKQETA